MSEVYNELNELENDVYEIINKMKSLAEEHKTSFSLNIGCVDQSYNKDDSGVWLYELQIRSTK